MKLTEIEGKDKAWREITLDEAFHHNLNRQVRLENRVRENTFVAEAYAGKDRAGTTKLFVRLQHAMHWTIEATKQQIHDFLETSIREVAVDPR